MNELLHFFGVAGFGSACTVLGFILGQRQHRLPRHREVVALPHDADVEAVIEAHARQVTAERGTPEAAGMVSDLAVTGWRSAATVLTPRRRWRSWKRW
jgi:hypothetical protein